MTGLDLATHTLQRGTLPMPVRPARGGDMIAARAVRPLAMRLGLLLLSALAVCAVAAMLHVIPYGRGVADYVFILDGIHRIGLGQVPHIDFASPIGPLTLYLAWLAEHLFPAGQPLVGLHALAWLALLPPFACLAPRFATGARFVAAMALLALIVLAPFTFDSTHLSEISYFASYNRFATGLLFLLGLWYVLPPRPRDAGSLNAGRVDTALLGYLLGMLFFLKITAAMIAFGVLVGAVLLGRARLRVAAGAAAGAVAVCAAIELPTGLVSGYLGNVVAMSCVNADTAAYNLLAACIRNWMPLAATVLVAALSVRLTRHGGSRLQRGVAPFVIKPFVIGPFIIAPFVVDTVVLIGMALLAESQNTGGVGLLAAAAILFHPSIGRNLGPNIGPNIGQNIGIAAGPPARMVAVVLLCGTLVQPAVDTAVSRTLTALSRERLGTTETGVGTLLPGIRVPLRTLAGARLFRQLLHTSLPLAEDVQAHQFNLSNDPTDNAPAMMLAWAEDVADAAAIFRADGLALPAGRYATLAFADPFARMLGLTPARGTALVMDAHRTMGLLSRREASRYLQDANAVFVARCELTRHGETTNTAVFDAVLAAEFAGRHLNACWDFYRRTADAPP